MANTKNATIVTTGSVSPYKTTLDAEDGFDSTASAYLICIVAGFDALLDACLAGDTEKSIKELDCFDELCRDARTVECVIKDKYPQSSNKINKALRMAHNAKITVMRSIYKLNSHGELSRTKTYILKNKSTGLCKIGRTNDVNGRIKALQTGAGVRLELLLAINENVETRLHRHFAKLRTMNEWFADDGSIEAFVSNYKRAVDDGMCLDISNFIAKNCKHTT